MGRVDHSRTPDSDYVFKGREINDFICTYKECLCELSVLERRILKLWFDAHFKQDHTPEEIAKMIERPKLTPEEVTGIKEYALKNIKNNPKMQKYQEYFG